MAYDQHFKKADDMIDHLEGVITEISDPFISSRYIGFVTISAVTVYELALKEIFIEFAKRKHNVFGEYTRSHFNRINGKIQYRNLKDDYIKKFGVKYLKRYRRLIEATEKEYLREHRKSLITSYNNMILWRNEFAHEGIIPSTVTFNEAVESYRIGKKMIDCVASVMVR